MEEEWSGMPLLVFSICKKFIPKYLSYFKPLFYENNFNEGTFIF